MKFKPGDRIICIDPSGNPTIKKGEVHTVIRYEQGNINVVGGGANRYYEWRFELAKEHLFDSLYKRMVE